MKTPTRKQEQYQQYRKNRGTFFLCSVLNGTEDENWVELIQKGRNEEKILRFPRIIFRSLLECECVKIDEETRIVTWIGKFEGHVDFVPVYEALHRTTTYINLEQWNAVEVLIKERHEGL